MDDWKTTRSFRPGAVAFEVRNEADVACFFDEANRKAIARTPVGKFGPDVFSESPMTITPLPDPPLTIGSVEIGDWKLDGSTLRGRLLSCSPTVFTLNFGKDALDALGARGGDELRLTIGRQIRPLKLLEGGETPIENWQCRLFKELGDEKLYWYLQVKRACKLGDDVIGDPARSSEVFLDPARLIAGVGEKYVSSGFHRPYLKEIETHMAATDRPLSLTPRPFARPPALCATIVPHWVTSDRDVLWVEAEGFVRDYSLSAIWNNAVPHEIDLAPGTEVEIMKV